MNISLIFYYFLVHEPSDSEADAQTDSLADLPEGSELNSTPGSKGLTKNLPD